ncbi:MAG: YkvA family protein [Dehalococcoidia bacterium]
MWIRIVALLVSMVVMRRTEASVLKQLTSSQTDDLLKRLAADSEMPKWARLLARAPWLYRMSPIDLIPDGIPFIGRFDDEVLTSFCLSLIARLSPKQHFERNLYAVKPPPPEPQAKKRRWPFSR